MTEMFDRLHHHVTEGVAHAAGKGVRRLVHGRNEKPHVARQIAAVAIEAAVVAAIRSGSHHLKRHLESQPTGTRLQNEARRSLPTAA